MHVFGGKKKKEKVAEVGSDLLKACSEEPQDFVRILQLVESYPKAMEFKDEEGRTAFHWCCAKRAKLEIVQYLGNANPGSVKEAAANGMLPLHYACREQAPIDVIQYLLTAYPQALFKDAAGWYPLHFACAKMKEGQLVLLILNSYPEVVRKKTQEGRLPIHYASAHQASIDLIAKLVRLAPETVRQGDMNEWTALHIAAAYNNSLPVIDYLIQQYRPGIQKRGHHGRMPLHIACLMKRNLDIIKHLVKQWPMGIKQMDESRMIPLHTACLAGCSIEVIKFLIREWPQSAMQLGKSSWEIARYAMQKQTNASQAEFDEFSKWLEKRVDGLGDGGEKKPTNQLERQRKSNPHRSCSSESTSSSGHEDGKKSKSKPKEKSKRLEPAAAALERALPEADAVPPEVIQIVGENLHQACELPQDLNEIKGIVESCPAAAECSTHNGNLPLHTACLNKATKDVIQYLIEKSPAALQKTDDGGNYPIHLACYSSSSYESIEYLVTEWPESLLKENQKKETPLSLARQPFYEAPNEVVVAMLETLTTIEQENEEEAKKAAKQKKLKASVQLDNYDSLERQQSTMTDWDLHDGDEDDRKPAARGPSLDSIGSDAGSKKSSFYQAAVAAATREDGSFVTGLSGNLPDEDEDYTSSATGVARRHSPEISSFYADAMKMADKEGGDDDSPPSKTKKPGIQHVAEPAVNVDSVMHRMEYGDTPMPHTEDSLRDDTDHGHDFVYDAANTAVSDSATAIEMANNAEKQQYHPQLSSFYQDALNARGGASDAFSEDAGDGSKSGAQKKPGVQYVEEPAVTASSVMYQMEYGDYPRPNKR